MRLPTEAPRRFALYRNLVRECSASRDQRIELHRRLRTVYLNGADQMEPVLYNRILEYVDTSASYLYDPEGPDFTVNMGKEHGDAFLEEEEAAADDFKSEWSKYTLTAALTVEWAHVYPSTVVKVFASDGQVAMRLLDDPADLSVWREDLIDFEDQEVFVHYYRMDLPSFERYLDTCGLDPEQHAIVLAAARDHAVRLAGGATTVLPPTQSRIILAAVTPSAIGNAQAAPMVSMATPNSDADVIELQELWVWDDSTGDWRVVTMFKPTETVLLEKSNPQPGIDAFYRLCLFPVAGYLWGLSPIERMIGLQRWRDERMGDIDSLVKLNLKPPRAFLGVSGINDEKAERLNTPGGHFTSAQPGGDIKTLAPPLTPDAWTLVDWIDRGFNRMGGLPPGADVGAEVPGIRAGDQLEAMSNLGSPRTRKRAMYVESFLNRVATAVERLRRRGPVKLIKPSTRQQFLLAQTPGDISVTVAGHSASPLYAERIFERALLVYDRQAIDDEDLVALSRLPGNRRLRAKARKIMEAKAERAKAMMGMKEQELAAKAVTAEAKMISARN